MHELGLVSHVIQTVQELCKENNLTTVASVTLQIGEVSGIMPEYLVDCWNWSCKKTEILKNAELRTEALTAYTFCENCGERYLTVKYAKECPKCHSLDTYLICGNEFIIKEIEAQ